MDQLFVIYNLCALAEIYIYLRFTWEACCLEACIFVFGDEFGA